MSEQIINSLKLEQSSILKLVELKLPDNSIIRLCDKYQVEYLGRVFEHVNFEISDLKEVASDEAVRPVFKMLNPNNLFTKLAISDKLEGALFDLTRIPEDEMATGNIVTVMYDRWKIYSIPNISQEISLNLRRLSDMSDNQIPPRRYSPPDFPTIKLK